MRRSCLKAGWFSVLCLSACPGTEPPDENYGPPRAQEPDASGTPDAAPMDASPADAKPDSTSSEAGPGDAGADGRGLVPDLEPLFAGCGEPPARTDDFTRERLRRAAVECASYQLCGFEAAAKELSEATKAYVDEPGDTTLAAARDAFRAAMAQWSRIEVMQFGPLGSMAPSAGEDMHQGAGLREQVYAWPLVSRCRVDEQLVERDYADEGVEAQLVSAKGLFALEYLLFAPEDGQSACAASSDTAKAWEALEADERASRRHDYAGALATEVASLAGELVALYEPSGTFAESFVDGSGYPSGQAALNVLGWALIYVEKELKDWKLGVAADITMMAPVTEAESPFTGISSRLLEQNLNGFARIFEGCGDAGAGLGFDDWLVAAGHDDLAEQMLDAQETARRAVAALPDDLAEAEPGQLRQTYDAVRELTTLLKSNLLGPESPLNLTLPATVEGDTD